MATASYRFVQTGPKYIHPTGNSYAVPYGQSYCVLDYAGTAGNIAAGTTDATASIQAAVTDCLSNGGGTVFFPPGSYLVTGQIVVTTTSPKHIRLLGVGRPSIIIGQNTDDVIVSNTTFNLAIERLCFTCSSVGRIMNISGDSGSNVGPVTIRDCILSGGATRVPASSAAAAIRIVGCDDVLIENNILSGNGVIVASAGSGIGSANGVKNYGNGYDILTDNLGASPARSRVKIRGNYVIQGHTVYGIMAYSAIYSDIIGNVVDGNNPAGVLAVNRLPPDVSNGDYSGYGIGMYNNDITPAYNRIMFNVVKNTAGSGIYAGAIPNSSIVGNTIENTARYEDDTQLPVGAIACTGNSSSLTIVGNNIKTVGGDKGVVGAWAAPGNAGAPPACGINVQGSGHTIQGNTIDGAKKHGILINGIWSDITINGNVVRNTGDAGIASATANTVTRVAVTGNTVSTCGGAGIILVLAADSNISANIVKGVTSQGIAVQTGSTVNIISANRIDNTAATDYGIYAQSTHTTIHGNTIQGGTLGIVSQGNYSSVLDNNLAGVGTPLSLSGTGPKKHGNRYTANALTGSVALSSGTSGAIATTEVLTGDSIRLTRLTPGGTAYGHLTYTIVNATSFTITAKKSDTTTEANDTSTILWEIVH